MHGEVGDSEHEDGDYGSHVAYLAPHTPIAIGALPGGEGRSSNPRSAGRTAIPAER